MTESGSDVLIEHLFRRQAGRIVSSLARLLGPQHLQLAEDAAQESMLRAVQLWPLQGMPEKPEGWLFRVAHHYALSALRRNKTLATMALPARTCDEPDGNASMHDDELRMIFMCCHPDLKEEARVALSLKLVGGFSVGEIARLVLTPEATIAQRLTRAKKLFRERALQLSLPGAEQLKERLESVLETIYLMFSAGHTAVSGEELIRRDVCVEALRLGRLIADSEVSTPRADALCALMAWQAARLGARTSAAGELVLLEEQDRSLWDRGLIQQGCFYFERSLTGAEVTAWHVQAAIAAGYTKDGPIQWASILAEYDLLIEMTDSPVAALNRAVVVGKVHGPEAGLGALTPLLEGAVLSSYYLLPAVRGHLLMQLEKFAEAERAFVMALACSCSEPERRFLRGRLALVQQRQREMGSAVWLE